MAAELTAVLFALDREARPFRRLARCTRRLSGPCPAWSNGQSLLVMQTGMGAQASRRALDWLLGAHRPARIVSAGFCGSLVAELPVGTVIQPSTIRQVGEGFVSPTRERGIDIPSLARRANGGTARQASLVSVHSPVLNRRAREMLRSQTGAEIVDMESATIASRCETEGIAFAGLRVVTDDLISPLPAELPSVVAGEQVLLRPLLAALFCRPGLAMDLIHLARRSRRAAQALAQYLRPLVSGS